MAIDYTDASAGLFTHIGKIVKRINNYEGYPDSTLPADYTSISDILQAGGQDAVAEGLVSSYDGFKSSVDGWRNTLLGYCTKRLKDPTTVIQQLKLYTDDLATVLAKLITQMSIDGKTINKSTVSLGSVTAAAANQGNGTVLVSKVLDGYSKPTRNTPAHNLYAGVDSELAVPSETMTLICVADSENDGRTEGQESFQWFGETENNHLSYKQEGSGQGPTIQTVQAATLLSNLDFETFSTNTPGSWTIDNGTAGTHIFAESTNYYHGAKAIKFLGTGAQAVIGISQAFSISQLRPLRRYLCTVRYKASGVPANGAILIQPTGTGFTAGSTEKIAVAAGAFPTSWTLGYFFINLPAIIPSDFSLAVTITSTLSNGTAVYFDNMAFAPVEWHGGVNLGVVAGSTRFMRGDKFTFTVANDSAGVFQEFFRRGYGVQLPSSGSPNINDSLVAT